MHYLKNLLLSKKNHAKYNHNITTRYCLKKPTTY